MGGQVKRLATTRRKEGWEAMPCGSPVRVHANGGTMDRSEFDRRILNEHVAS